LAMHGAPPKDFPGHELAEWFQLHERAERADVQERSALEQREAQLEARMRAWPRTEENDPFYVNSVAMGVELSEAAGLPVVVGFNEFCAPSLDEAMQQAIDDGAQKLVVITPMLTPGGEHAQHDIPAAIERVQRAHPDVPILYAWPFKREDVARFLAARVVQEL
jgi:sirohydrochlorin cobaltochelatase